MTKRDSPLFEMYCPQGMPLPTTERNQAIVVGSGRACPCHATHYRFTNRRFLMRDHAASTTTIPTRGNTHNTKSHGSLDADIIIKNAPDPVFVSDLEGKILSANDAVYELLGFRTDEVLEQSLSRFISTEDA